MTTDLTTEPAGTDITPPCTPTAWYFLHPETDGES